MTECPQIKICFWLDIPSHHQRAFMEALHEQPGVDLQVRYRAGFGASRLKQGWKQEVLREFENIIPAGTMTEEVLDRTLPDWRSRIHVYSFRVYKELPKLLAAGGAPGCQWSERGGLIVSKLAGFRPWLYRLLMPFYKYLWKLKDAWILRHRMSVVFAPGELNLKYFHSLGVPREKLHNLYYAVAPIPVAPPDERISAFARGRRCFLYIGGLRHAKGTDVLLRAWNRIRDPHWCLILCGYDFSGGKYRRLANKLELNDSVLFYGTCPADRTAALYHAADVFVFPTRYDGWGMVLQEAASVGLPLIGTDMAGSSAEVITPGKNGSIVPADDEKALARAMKSYIEHEELIAEHGNASREIFFRSFTPEKNVERLLDGLAKLRSNMKQS